MASVSRRWLVPMKRCDNPKVRLLCFPYGGGGTAPYWSWQSDLPADTELWGVRLPGRENRIAEEPMRDANEVVACIFEEVKSLNDVKSVFYGHSLGAGLAFETAKQLRHRNERQPLLLVASGRLPPHIGPTELWADQPENELLGYLAKLGGVPFDPSDKMFLSVYLPVIRADFGLDATLPYGHSPAFDFPITIINGKDDPIVNESQLEEWRQYTNSGFKSHLIEGDHFFIHSNFHEFFGLLLAQLQELGVDDSHRRSAV